MGGALSPTFAAKKAGWILRWILFFAAASLVLEVISVSLLERFRLMLPAAERRAACEECEALMSQLDTLVMESSEQEARRLLSSLKRADIGSAVRNSAGSMTEYTRKEVAKQSVAAVCHAASAPRDCQQTLAKFKIPVMRQIVSASAVFDAAMFAVATAVDPEGGYVAPPEMLEAVSTWSLKTLCSGPCHPVTLREAFLPEIVLTDPSLRGAIETLGELWGAVIIVGMVGALLIMTLQIRCTAARRQHMLYQRLVTQLKGRVSSGPPATNGGPPSRRMTPNPGARSNGR